MVTLTHQIAKYNLIGNVLTAEMSTKPESLSAEATLPGSLRFPVVPDKKHDFFKNRKVITVH